MCKCERIQIMVTLEIKNSSRTLVPEAEYPRLTSYKRDCRRELETHTHLWERTRFQDVSPVNDKPSRPIETTDWLSGSSHGVIPAEHTWMWTIDVVSLFIDRIPNLFMTFPLDFLTRTLSEFPVRIPCGILSMGRVGMCMILFAVRYSTTIWSCKNRHETLGGWDPKKTKGPECKWERGLWPWEGCGCECYTEVRYSVYFQ